MEQESPSRTLQGLGVAEGVAIGQFKVVDTAHVPAHVPQYRVEERDIEREIDRLKAACERAREQLESLADQVEERLGPREAEFIRAQALMIDDAAFLSEVEQLIIEENVNAEAAVSRVMERFENMVAQLDDQYLRERSSDIRDASRRILSHLLFIDGEMPPPLPEPVVVGATHLVPSLTVHLEREKILAFAAEHGGYTSHAAILARSLGIPAVTGLSGLTEEVMDGETVIIDGFQGLAIVAPTLAQIEHYGKLAASHARRRHELLVSAGAPAVTVEGQRITVQANVGRADEVDLALKYAADGIGLYRTEVEYLSQTSLPSEDMLAEHYGEAAAKFPRMGVTFRALDIGGDKFPPSVPLAHEDNPFIGMRGLRLLLEHVEDLMLPQARALLRASARGNISLMYPMIASLADLEGALDLFERARTEVLEAGHEVAEQVAQGVMIEVPSAIPILPDLLEQSDFASVGTNDLVQYLLAADRNSDRMADAYNPFHPAVIRTLNTIRLAAEEAGKPVSVCGEIASDPCYVPLLIGLGYRTLSVNVGAVPNVKRIVRSLSAAECAELAEDALGLHSARGIHAACRELMAERAEPDGEGQDAAAS